MLIRTQFGILYDPAKVYLATKYLDSERGHWIFLSGHVNHVFLNPTDYDVFCFWAAHNRLPTFQYGIRVPVVEECDLERKLKIFMEQDKKNAGPDTNNELPS